MIVQEGEVKGKRESRDDLKKISQPSIISIIVAVNSQTQIKINITSTL